MNSDNEFTKPLKGISAREKPSSKRAVWISLLLVAVIGLPLFQFYGEISLLVPDAEPVAEQQVAKLETKQATEQPSSEVTDTIPSRRHEVDPSLGDLQELQPDGSLEIQVPKPFTPQTNQSVKRQEVALAHLPDPNLVERGATGVIPKISPDGLKPMDMYSRQPETEGNFGVARVVIVIGGLGISQTSTQEAIKELPPSVTLAFAPYGNSLNRWMQQARKSGHELLLQLPMEPIGYPQNNPGPHTLKATADLEENLANLHWAMSRITNYVGVTNYLGNKMMQEPAGLSPIFAEISKRGLLFFEDGSVKNTVGPGVAVKELVPYAKADIQLDNVRSRRAIAEKLQQLAEQAKRTGLAIGMGNAFPDTISLVAQFARQAKQNGIEITPVSAVVKGSR